MYLLCKEHAALDRGRELALAQLNFSAAFDDVNHSVLLFKLPYVKIVDVLFDIIVGFLSGRELRLMVCSVTMIRWSLVFLKVVSFFSLLVLLFMSDLLVNLS